MSSKEFAEKLVSYMKKHRDRSIKQKCQELGIKVQTYYSICKKYGVDSRIGPRTPVYDVDKLSILLDQKL